MRRLLNTLYVTNPNALLRKKDDALSVVLDGKQKMSVPFHVLEGVVLFGHVGCSMAVLAACADRGVGVVLLDERGRFKARVEGPVSGSILLRKEQYRRAADEEACLHLATRFLQAKLHNSSTVLKHYVRDYPDLRESVSPVLTVIGTALEGISELQSLQDIRGAEGDCARRYFSISQSSSALNLETNSLPAGQGGRQGIPLTQLCRCSIPCFHANSRQRANRLASIHSSAICMHADRVDRVLPSI